MPVFKGTNTFYDYHFSDIVEYNLKRRLEYGLLEKKAFTVKSDVILVPAEQAGKTSGTVWEVLGENISWEDNAHNDIVKPANIFVDGSFYSGGKTIDYARGKVVLDVAVPKTSEVKIDTYTFPDVAVYDHDDERHKVIIAGAVEAFQSKTSLVDYAKEKKIWLPCVFIQTDVRSMQPYEQGGNNVAEILVVYKIYSPSPFSNKALRDMLLSDYKELITIFDPNDAGFEFPFLYNGAINNQAKQYDQLVSDTDIYLTNAYVDSVSTGSDYSIGGIYSSEVRQTLTVHYRI